MYHSTPGSLTVQQAVDGFLQFKIAENSSPRTIEGYRSDLKNWLAYQGDGEITRVSPADLRGYLVYLKTDYRPRRLSGRVGPLAPKTLRNIWITLSSLFSWLQTEFNHPSPMREVPAPKFQKAEIQPFTQEEIKALLKASELARETHPGNRQAFTARRRTAYRDQALILLLLDTGLRASEVVSLKIGDVDKATGKVQVRHGPQGGAKGGKGRTVYLGKTARKTLWRYLVTREDANDWDAPLFEASDKRMTRDALRLMLRRLGEKAEIKNCHPHRLRHTFAITYLRSGGDVFTLQKLLGHSSLDMVEHYARVAQLDIEQAHRQASPVDNWRL